MYKSEHIKNIVENLPEMPGVYQYFNAAGDVIYVGKAKNLRKRVSQYFNKSHDDSPKTEVLVRNISTLMYIVVETEEDALLLEYNLIKKYRPRYNVMLKDDKSYPCICIKNEHFPRIFKTRKLVKDGSKYYGPYSSFAVLSTMMQFIRELYQFRTCKLNLTEENIKAKRFKECLQFHIKNCKAPCIGLQTEEDYQKTVSEIRELIKGNVQSVSDILMHEMQRLAKKQRFEEAQKIKEKYQIIEKYRANSIVINPNLNNIDVFSYDEDEGAAYINILRIVKGSIVQGFTIEYRKKLDEPKEDILTLAIVELRERLQSDSPEILVPFKLNLKLKSVKITVPRLNDERKKLLELSLQNVRQYKIDKLKQAEKLNPDQRVARILGAVQKALHLEKLPMHIECFDNSNIQGTNAVAACVVFKKAKPAKNEYRKYNIKTVVGADDYASMKEVVRRRYTRMIAEATPLPDLIITDGGTGQMGAVRQVIEDELQLKIPIAGLAKDKKHRTNEVLFGFPPAVVGLKPTDEAFRFLSSIQDEVHRFAITFHRKKRSKSQVTSELDKIDGIGEISKKQLLLHFKSVKRIRMASKEEIEKIIGTQRASMIYEYFRDELTS
jgi:excinuclease ABC subunit C